MSAGLRDGTVVRVRRGTRALAEAQRSASSMVAREGWPTVVVDSEGSRHGVRRLRNVVKRGWPIEAWGGRGLLREPLRVARLQTDLRVRRFGDWLERQAFPLADGFIPVQL